MQKTKVDKDDVQKVDVQERDMQKVDVQNADLMQVDAENTNNAEGRFAQLGGLEVRELRSQSACTRRHESTARPTFRRRARGRKCQKAPKPPILTG